MNEESEIEDLKDELAELKQEVEALRAGRERRKARLGELWRENQRLKEAHQQTLRMLALVLLSVPGKRVEVEDSTVTVYAPARTKLCSDRLLTGTATAMWVEVEDGR